MDEEGAETSRSREEFESNKSVHNFHILVTDTLLERCATQLSMNERIVSREATMAEMGKARKRRVRVVLTA